MYPNCSSFSLSKPVFTLLFFFSSFSAALTQNNQWTWVNGDNLTGKPGVYGSKGIADPGNKPGGRNNASQWTDGNGNLWLMGGFGLAASGTGNLNDLWIYSTVTNSWTWVSGDNTINPVSVYGTKGTPAPDNKPGGRSAGTSFTDASGNLWFMGGYNNAYYNDLWKFTPSTTQWTWVGGDNTGNKKGIYGVKGMPDVNNKPGARYSSAACTDANGDIWFFGGYGYGATGADSYLNDLWKFTPSTGEWTWVSGDNATGQVGVYGTKGLPAADNKPGARYSPAMWTDAGGNVWLFGGTGFALTTAAVGGELNDLWKFTPSTGEWTWVNGDNAVNAPGVYGTVNVPAATNKPGGRHSMVVWKDPAGAVYLFGGNGYPASSGLSNLNDLWKLDISSNQWTWIEGSNIGAQKGVYGVTGTAADANMPGARYATTGWLGAGGKLWLFGGSGLGSTVVSGYLNDLWMYTLPNSLLPVTLSHFTAQQLDGKIVLTWGTAQEENSDHFGIERSSSGSVFNNIGNVTASGNSSTVNTYSFTDIAPLTGTNSYRLKQYDRDGVFQYSKVVSVWINKNDGWGLTLLQNPVQGNLRFAVQLGNAQKIKLVIKNTGGNVLVRDEHSFAAGNSVLSLPVDHLPKGMYYLTLVAGGTEGTKSFIKL